MTHCSPGESLVPEGGAFFQTEQYSSNGSPKGSCHSSSSSTRYKVSLVSIRRTLSLIFYCICILHKPVRSEVRVWKLDEPKDDAPKLWYASSYDCTTVDHRSFLANKETCDKMRDCARFSYYNIIYLLLKNN